MHLSVATYYLLTTNRQTAPSNEISQYRFTEGQSSPCFVQQAAAAVVTDKRSTMQNNAIKARQDIRDDTDRIRYEAIPDPTQYVCLKKHIAKIKCTDAHAPTLTSYEES
jgi:hypothetical protein